MFHYQADTDLIHYLAICNTPQIGSKKLLKLLHHFKSFDAILGSQVSDLVALGFSPALSQAIVNPHYVSAKQDLAWHHETPTHHIITMLDPDYPAQLRQIATFPPVLYAKGNITLLSSPQIAIVGSRNPSASGLMNAQTLTIQLCQQGYTITSGLALGIDAKAHQAALSTSKATIAVLGTGLNKIYPHCHQALAQEISEHGLLVSEFSVNMPAKAEHFPRRNRIISGLSLGVLVVEAAQKSGSLVTARYAIEQNREVFAIPGAIHNPLARGCHQLIRQGAKLVETVSDILEELPTMYTTHPIAAEHKYLAPLEQQLFDLLKETPVPFEYLVEQTGEDIPTLTAALTQLTLHGLLKEGAIQ